MNRSVIIAENLKLYFNTKWKFWNWKLHLKWIILSRLISDGGWQINGIKSWIQINSNNQNLKTKRKRIEKLNRDLVIFGSLSNNLTHTFEKIMVKISKFDDNKLTYLRNSMVKKHCTEKIIHGIIITHLLKTKDIFSSFIFLKDINA